MGRQRRLPVFSIGLALALATPCCEAVPRDPTNVKEGLFGKKYINQDGKMSTPWTRFKKGISNQLDGRKDTERYQKKKEERAANPLNSNPQSRPERAPVTRP